MAGEALDTSQEDSAGSRWLRHMAVPTIQLWMTALPAVGLLFLIAIAGAFFHVDIGLLTRDPADIAHMHPLTGLVSNLGVLLWGVTAGVCLFTAITARGRRAEEISKFALCAGLLSAFLTFDDLFMIHEGLVRRYLKINEDWVYAMLGVATLGFLVRFRPFILRSDIGFLVLGLGFLGLSVVVDAILTPVTSSLGYWHNFIEDGFKWLGIACWCSYFVRTCYQAIVEPARFARPDQSRTSF